VSECLPKQRVVGSNPGMAKNSSLPKHFNLLWNETGALSSEVKQPECFGDRSLPLGAEVKNGWS
jgi:hypothetical protein